MLGIKSRGTKSAALTLHRRPDGQAMHMAEGIILRSIITNHNIRHLLERARVSSEESGVGCDVTVVA